VYKYVLHAAQCHNNNNNEEGATALCNAIQMILRPKGNVIGVLPDYRVGIDLFENIMESNGFVPKIIESRMELENVISKTCDSFLIKILLNSDGGETIRKKNTEGRTPLYMAADRGDDMTTH